MTVIVENGTGVAGANSNVSVLFVSAYLTDRNRETENGWANGAESTEEDAAVVDATDHIENRFRLIFLGQKKFRDIQLARSTLTLTAQPLDAETVTIGSVTYTFRTAIVAANDVLIGASTAASVVNLNDAVNANVDTSGTGFHEDTVVNPDAGAELHTGDTLLAFGLLTGTADNAVVTTTTVTGATWNFPTLHGGTDIITPQPLSFPRVGLVDRDGITIEGMPLRLLHATAEYSVRARNAATVLAPDPSVDPFGGTVTRLKEKVGPIETDTEYLPGTANSGTLPAYPAADRLLRDFIRTSGAVIRG